MTKLTPVPLADRIVTLRKLAGDLTQGIDVLVSECDSLRRRLAQLSKYPTQFVDERNACDSKLRSSETELAEMKREREHVLADLEGARLTWKETHGS